MLSTRRLSRSQTSKSGVSRGFVSRKTDLEKFSNTNYYYIDQQLVRDGESSCFEEMFFGETYKCQSIRPP